MKSFSEIEQLIDDLKRRRSFLTTVLRNLRKAKEGDRWDAFSLRRALTAVQHSPDLDPASLALVADVLIKSERAVAAALLELESAVRDLCRSEGWMVDGQWPTLYVARAIELKLDERRLAFRAGNVKLSSLDMDGLRAELAPRVAALLPRGFSPSEFVAQVAHACDAASSQEGAAVAILRVYRELVTNSQRTGFWRDATARKFTELNREQFVARLSAALESGETVAPDGRNLRLLPPIDPKDAFFVYQPAERRFGFVGRIRFDVPSGKERAQ